MRTAAFIVGLAFICSKFTEITTTEGQLKETFVQSECRDRYLWIHVASGQTPRFEAVDGNGVHSISEQLASHCGYTISTFKMDGFTTFKASYYSCFTHNQNDEVFSFKFNVMVSDADGRWISQPVSAVCSGLIWTHREIICEEDYMEVNVNRESSCGGGDSGQMWRAAFSQAQRTASSVWQLMVLRSDGQATSMSISEAERQGYSLTTSAQRVVLRSQYRQPHAELTMVDGVSTEVVRVSLFFKQKLMVMMIDLSMACTVNSGSFDGTRLLWDVPWLVTPLIGEGVRFESRSLSLGVEGLLLDQTTVAARGFSVVQQGDLIQIGVPFGAEGGYRKSLVVNNMYKETYVIFLMYEHVFSLLYEDGSSVDTRHRMLRVLDTPLLCRPPFSLDQTITDDQVFTVYLGNIPADVLLEDVWINGRQLIMSDAAERGYSISPVVHVNGSRAYELRLPFEDASVHWMYLGQGVVQYYTDINFTLTIMPQRDSYYHHTSITARVLDAFPPEITAQCSDRGITFSVVRPPRAQSLWEVGLDHEPLTSQLAAQRGYRLYNDTGRITLEVPVFSVGYDYEDINLSNFYGTFKLLLRDSKTLEVQTSTSKRCLFKTQDMIVCSADGTMLVVTTPTSTWPTVQPERTTLLDPTCGPKQTDGARVLFEFRLDSCGTRAMVGDYYMVYENEIIHDRQMIADGPNFISRESQFRLTVRCFYPLSGVNRLSVDRIFRSETPGFGSVKVFKSVKDSESNPPAQDCSRQAFGNAINTTTNQVHQTPAAAGALSHTGVRPWPKPGPSHFITGTSGHNRLLSSQNLQTFPNLNAFPPPEGPTIGTHQGPLQVLSHPGHLTSQTLDQNVLGSPNDDHFPPRYDQLPDTNFQLSNLDTPREVTERCENRIPDTPVVGQLHIDSGSSGETSTLQGWSSKTEEISGYQHQSLYHPPHTPQFHPAVQPPAQYSQDHLDRSEILLPGRGMQNPAYVGHIISSSSVDTPGSGSTEPMSTATSQVNQNLKRPGSIERRNTDTVHSRVRNIRVKPLSKYVSFGHHLNQKPLVQQANSQIANPSQYASGPPAVRNDGSQWPPRQLPEHRASNIRQEHVPKRARVSTLKQQQGVHSVGVNSDQTAAIRLTDRLPNQKLHQQKLVQSVAETGNNGGQESGSTRGNVLQSTGESRVRVKFAPSLPGKLKTHYEPKVQNLQNPTTSRTQPGLTPQSIPTASSDTDLNFTPGGAEFTGFHSGPNGSGGSSSDLNIHTTSDCSGQYGVSVHKGIMRGKRSRG